MLSVLQNIQIRHNCNLNEYHLPPTHRLMVLECFLFFMHLEITLLESDVYSVYKPPLYPTSEYPKSSISTNIIFGCLLLCDNAMDRHAVKVKRVFIVTQKCRMAFDEVVVDEKELFLKVFFRKQT